MKPIVRVMSTITTVWTLLIFVLIALMVLPVIPGVVSIQLPSSEGWATTITNESVSMTSNISVRNGGLFPFNDFYFVLELYGNNATPLVEFSSPPTNLQTNTLVKIPVTFEINRSNFGDDRLRTLLFDKLTVGGLVYFNTRYLLDFRAQLGINGSVSFGPLVQQLDYRVNQSRASLIGDNATLTIPYSVNSSLQGRNISVSGTISNDTQQLGTFNHSFNPSQQGQGEFNVNLTREAYDHLTTSPDHLILNVTVTFDNFVRSYQTERDWQPPTRG